MIAFDRGIGGVDAAHIAEGRTLPEAALEFGELFSGGDGVDFDAAIIEVACIAADAEFGGMALDEVAVSDALHAAPDKVAFRLGFLRHRRMLA